MLICACFLGFFLFRITSSRVCCRFPLLRHIYLNKSGSDLLKITLYENNNNLHYIASFRADVSNNGMQAIYKVEWLEEGVQILFLDL